jgi:hypothetical protein
VVAKRGASYERPAYAPSLEDCSELFAVVHKWWGVPQNQAWGALFLLICLFFCFFDAINKRTTWLNVDFYCRFEKKTELYCLQSAV